MNGTITEQTASGSVVYDVALAFDYPAFDLTAGLALFFAVFFGVVFYFKKWTRPL